jgi:hypothetical protein
VAAQKIIVAAGVEIRDFQGKTLLAYLNTDADAGKGSTWTFPKGAAAGKATYVVEVVYTMPEFAKALDTDDAIVIYEGHSRYGQGPAFGDMGVPHVPDKKTYPVNPWGVHYRMGYDATDTECIDDLVAHSVTPAEYDLTTPPKMAFLPKALVTAAANAKTAEAALKKAKGKRRCTTKGAWREFDVCQKKLAATKTARGDEPLKGRHFYAHLVKKPADEFMTSVTVGSADLDKASLKCKVLFMASCSSHEHYFEPLDKRRTAVKSKCKFYMTAYVCSAYHGRNFIRELFGGTDPLSKKGSKAMLKALNGETDSGVVGFY